MTIRFSKRTIITLREVLTMFEDKIEAMNKLPNAVDDSSGFEKRVYTVEEIMDILSIERTLLMLSSTQAFSIL